MGVARQDRPLESQDTAVLRFAAVTGGSGEPDLRELSRRAHYSPATLSEAAGGRKLPSLAVTTAYVTACGADPTDWQKRWREVLAESNDEAGHDDTRRAEDDQPAPYVGLAAFQPADADWFAADPENLHPRVRQALADQAAEVDLLLVIDQFEEVFTLCNDSEERERFIAALVFAATTPTSRVRVVLGVRADFYGHCGRHPELVKVLCDAQILIGAMTTDELREAIIGPAAAMSAMVESALVTRLIADAKERPGVLPLVSHALLETWRSKEELRL
jgi:hypothetical protein